MFKRAVVALATLSMTGLAHAVLVPVDLTGWVVNAGPGTQSAANWVVQPGNDSVRQIVNSATSVFFDPGNLTAQGTALAGQITVGNDGDNDFVGFVLGYNPGEISMPGAPNDGFYLIDWKQADQGAAADGLALSHVTGPFVNAADDYWAHSGGVTEIARATNLGSTGWVDNTLYNFELVFTDQLIKVTVDNSVELNVTAAQAGVASFADGAFGFYNYSQSQVLYAGITEEDFCVVNPQDPACTGTPVPAPGTLALLGVGFAAMGWLRRKNIN